MCIFSTKELAQSDRRPVTDQSLLKLPAGKVINTVIFFLSINIDDEGSTSPSSIKHKKTRCRHQTHKKKNKQRPTANRCFLNFG